MMCAAHANQLEVFNMLVNHPSITADRARYCVNDAAARGLVNMLSLLMSSRPDAGDPQESRRSPPMMVAAYVGNIRVMDVLLQHGADVNDTEGSPWSSWDGAGNPLEAAVRGMQPAAIKWLLKRGADAGPALRTAAQRDMVNILQLMVEHGADIKVHGPSALIKAMSAPALKAALCLLKLGTPTDTHAFLQALGLQQASEYEGWLKQCLTGYNSEQSGLLYNAATEHGHHEFGEMLAKAGACGSQTACHIAACSKVQAII
jgi:ankyrin repeat protein